MTDATNPRYWKIGDRVKVVHHGHDYYGWVGSVLAVNRRNAQLLFDDGKKKQVPRSFCRWVRRLR